MGKMNQVKESKKRDYTFAPKFDAKQSFENDYQYTMKPISKYGLVK